MSLSQFGAVITFAIDLEKKISKFYEKSVDELGGNFIETLMNRSKLANKHRKMLEKTRRENVTEMTLEPIEGLSEEAYKIDFEDYSITGVTLLESTIKKFYEDAGPKINVLESRRVFEKCFKEYNKLTKLE